MVDSTIDFNLICRTCLSFEMNLINIYDTDVAEMANVCQFIKVSPNDGYPNNICLRCQELITISYNFKQQCEKSQATLATYLLKECTSLKEVSNMLENNKVSVEFNSIDESKHNRVFNCNHCEEKYTNETDYLLHQTTHTKPNSNKDLQVLKKHEKGHLKRKSNKYNDDTEHTHIECTGTDTESSETVFKNRLQLDCKDTTASLTAFLDEEPSSPLPFPCSECSQSFNAECDLQLHQSTHSKTGEYVCERCSKKFATRQMLKRHIKTHMLHKPHMCQQCGKGFAESHALTKHMRRHTGQPREKKHLCTVCGQGFSEPFYLNVHMRKHTGERPLMCCSCGKSFADPRSLKAHNMTHTGERPYKCHLCNKAFSQSVNLTKHIRVHTGEKPYVCSKCGKCFTQSSSLDKHVRTHTGERPYACDQCPRRFAEKGTLIHHQRTHTGEKPYVCARCGKSFASSSELRLHDRKHTGLKKNVCSVCGKDFATPSNLVVHSRTHSGEKPFVCYICGRPFADKGSLRKHSKIHIDKTKDVNSCTSNYSVQDCNNAGGVPNAVGQNTDSVLNERMYYNLN